MPMQLLCIRLMVDHIFRNTYHEFYAKEQHEKIASKLINDVITHMLDPNLFFSRFSFLESGMHAITLKQDQAKGGSTLPKLRNKFFTRSTLVQQLVPHPSEGRVRVIFGGGSEDPALKRSGSGAMTAKPGMRKRSRMIQGIVSGADSVEGHGDMWAKKQAGMLSMRTAS